MPLSTSQPDVLNDVAGRVVITRYPPDVFRDRRMPPLDQLVEGGALAKLAADDEQLVLDVKLVRQNGCGARFSSVHRVCLEL